MEISWFQLVATLQVAMLTILAWFPLLIWRVLVFKYNIATIWFTITFWRIQLSILDEAMSLIGYLSLF